MGGTEVTGVLALRYLNRRTRRTSRATLLSGSRHRLTVVGHNIQCSLFGTTGKVNRHSRGHEDLTAMFVAVMLSIRFGQLSS